MMQVKIEKLDHFGRGITTIDGKLCFIQNGLKNEVVEIEITKNKKKYYEGKVINIINESTSRKKVECPYYEICGGCQLMHLDYQEQLKYKEEKVSELLKRFASIDIKLNKIIHDNDFYYRNKLTLHGNNKKIGLYKEETRSLIEIDKCLISNEKINEIIKRLNEYLNNSNDSIEEIIIKNTTLEEVMLVIKGNITLDNFIGVFNDMNSIYLNDKLIYGTESILEKINDLYFEIYPNSFFQVNYKMMLEMYNKVIEYYKNHNNLKVLDLYCGTGTIGISISKYAKEVIGIEVNKDAITSANKNRIRNNISNISFYLGKVEDNIDSFNDIDSVVVDPPRSGLDKYTINSIVKMNPLSLIYISCDPVTLARDLNILKEYYEIKEIQPIDMFPNTYHVENVCILERR